MPRRFLLILSLLLIATELFAQAPLRKLYPLPAGSKPDTSRVKLLLQWATYYLDKAGEEKSDQDSTRLLIQQAEQFSKNLDYAKGLGKSYFLFGRLAGDLRDVPAAKSYLQKARSIFEKHDCFNELGQTYLETTRHYSLSDDDVKERIRLVKLAQAAYVRADNRELIAFTYRELGDLYQVLNELAESMDNLKQSLSIYQSINYTNLYGVYDLMGTVYDQMDDNEQALKYALLAVHSIEASGDTSLQLCTIYNRAGVVSYKIKQYSQAEEYFSKSIAIAIKYRDTASIRIVTPNVVNTHVALNKGDNAIAFLKKIEPVFLLGSTENQINLASNYVHSYLSVNQPEKAEIYYLKLLELMKKTSEPFVLRALHNTVVKYLGETRQYKKLATYLPAYDSLCKAHVTIIGQSNVQLWWFRIDSAAGNYLSAIHHYQQFKILTDSVFNIAKNRQRAQFQIQYETGKKDQDIALKEKNIQLLTSEAQLQQTQLKQTRLVKNLTFGGIALSAIIIGLLFNRYRLKQRSNKQLQLQQEEINRKNNSLEQLVVEKEWLLKEIHHRVKNNLQMVMSLLNTQSAFLENETAVEAIRNSQHRMQAISLIHKKLYQSDNTAMVDMPVYIGEMIDYLKESFSASDHISFNKSIGPVRLDVAHAVPLGLILNEAITNAIKYAFPGNRKGTISITLLPAGDHHFVLTIADNGIGLPPGFDAGKSNSLGMSLMQGLSKQLGCNFTITSNNGTTITINFKETKVPADNLSPEVFHLSEEMI